MKKSAIKKELRSFAEAVVYTCWDISDNRDYFYETLTAEIKTGFLNEEQEFEIENFLDELDEEINQNDFLVAELYGVYRDEYGVPHKAHYTEAVVPSPLADSYTFKHGSIFLEVTFEIVATEHDESDSIVLSSDSFQEKLLNFTVLSEEEYDNYED